VRKINLAVVMLLIRDGFEGWVGSGGVGVLILGDFTKWRRL
jgi:hypothetical protein